MDEPLEALASGSLRTGAGTSAAALVSPGPLSRLTGDPFMKS